MVTCFVPELDLQQDELLSLVLVTAALQGLQQGIQCDDAAINKENVPFSHGANAKLTTHLDPLGDGAVAVGHEGVSPVPHPGVRGLALEGDVEGGHLGC